MEDLKSVVVHHLEQAARKAGVRFDVDCRAELDAACDAAERRIANIEKDLATLLAARGRDRRQPRDWRPRT